jgi:hypothetical protein
MDIPKLQTIPYNEDYSLMIYQTDFITNDTFFYTSKLYSNNVLLNSIDTYNGEFNTQLIYDNNSVIDSGAKACLSFVDSLDGYSDYYLPSVDELQAVLNAGYIPSGFYMIWTSTEYDINEAYALNVDTGLFEVTIKSEALSAMPIRKVYLNDVITIERMNLLSSQAPILNGGVNNADEDVYKMLGGINGISKNSKILINE